MDSLNIQEVSKVIRAELFTVISTDVILGQDREAGSQVENFLRTVSADPADCPQVSEDA